MAQQAEEREGPPKGLNVTLNTTSVTQHLSFAKR